MERKKRSQKTYTRIIGMIWNREIEAHLYPVVDRKLNKYKLVNGKVWHKGNKLKIEDFNEILLKEQIKYE